MDSKILIMVTLLLMGRHDNQHYDIQHNDTQHNDTRNNGSQHNDTEHYDTEHNDTGVHYRKSNHHILVDPFILNAPLPQER